MKLSKSGCILQIDKGNDADPGTVVVRSYVNTYLRILASIFLLPTMAVGTGAATLPVLFVVDDPVNVGFEEIVLGVLCFAVFGVLGVLLAVLGSLSWLQLLFPRILVFDLRSRFCQFENVPGFGCKIQIDEIDSVVLGSVLRRNAWLPMLCLRVRGWKRLLRVHQEYCTCDSPEAAMERLESPAEFLSQLLDCPLSRIGTIGPFQMSWR